MGQAKKRGTFEERVAQAKARRVEEIKAAVIEDKRIESRPRTVILGRRSPLAVAILATAAMGLRR